MKKFVIALIILASIGVAVFLFLPKEYLFEIPGEKLQEGANKKFPQTIGKSIKIENPLGNLKPRNLPNPFENMPKPKIPTANHILAEITLKNPKIDLSEGKLHLQFLLNIRIMGGHLFEWENNSDLTSSSEYENISQDIAQKFADEYQLSSEAKIRMSGKDTWLVKDQQNIYMIAIEKEKAQVFQTEKGGKESRHVSTGAKAKISGQLKYDREVKTVFFHGATVDELEIDKLPDAKFLPTEKIREIIKEKVNGVLQEQTIPICDLKDTANTEQPKVAKILGLLFLKEIIVGENKLTIVLSLKH